MLFRSQAIGLALVVTELVANAAKHAYPDDRHGLVWVRLARCDGETRQISVSDEGVGLPADFEINKKIGFGMRIVRALARQTRAQLRIERLSSFWKFRLARTGQFVRTDLKREQRKSRQSMKRRKFITLLGSAVAYAERSDKD